MRIDGIKKKRFSVINDFCEVCEGNSIWLPAKRFLIDENFVEHVVSELIVVKINSFNIK